MQVSKEGPFACTLAMRHCLQTNPTKQTPLKKMSLLNWIFRRKAPPAIFLGDVQMHLDWNMVSSFCHYFGAPVQAEPEPDKLRGYFARALDLPLYGPDQDIRPGDQLVHLAITDLRYGFFTSINANNTWIPLVLRPSITLYGYLVDIDSGQVLAEKRVTQKPSWLSFTNPVLFAWSYFLEDITFHDANPMSDKAAQKALRSLKKVAAQMARTGHLLEKNRIT
ncbi:hypothetical protein [Roseibium sp. Sym1]|uniref:hypothetical protein n=1 Tax=Roseibium sp. Sym1 TaxID=3016006 RepID=UPI0022B3104E|nr:hypothetical protein [Roseibium sp. Sym1]